MNRFLSVWALFVVAATGWPRSPGPRHVRNPITEVLRSRQFEARRPVSLALRDDPGRVAGVLPDAGNIAIIDDTDGVVSTPFDLDNLTVEFQAGGVDAAQYTHRTMASRFDADALGGATRLALDDDAAVQVSLPFSFPFFGRRHSTVFVHSDGNVTFVASDPSSLERDIARLVTGPPRVAPLFTDLDPSQPDSAIAYVSTAARFLVIWNNIPFWSPTPGSSVLRQTFQLALYPDGRIEFSYRGIRVQESVVVGISPGLGRVEDAATVDLSAASTAALRAAIVEEFFALPQLNRLALIRKFYRNHEDIADFLVVFDSTQRDFCAEAFPIRNWVRGIGLGVTGVFIEEFNSAPEAGSAGRLQNVIFMGPLSRYPADPSEVRPLPGCQGRNSTLSVLGQEAGHRFLAYSLFVDPATSRVSNELLGRDFAHWNYYFNSDASFVEGNRIEDKGAGVSPRFETTQIVQRFGAFDQYLMGLRAPEDVPASFLVRQPSIDFRPAHEPQAGITFDGTRVEMTVPMIVAAEGRRAPDHTVSPKVFRFAFALLIPAGSTPSPADLQKLDRIRTEWETTFARATDNRARAETPLVKQMALSAWPAAGLVQGRTLNASLTLAAPAAAAVVVTLAASTGAISVPASVTIPAGRASAEFPITANSAGIAELTAQGPDASYETARAFLQVRAGSADLRLEQLYEAALPTLVLTWDYLREIAALLGAFVPPADAQYQGGLNAALREELFFRVRDDNFLPYPGVRVNAVPNGGGSVEGSSLVTDARGWVRVRWRLDPNPGSNTLTLALEDQPARALRIGATGLVQPPRRRDPRAPIEPAP